jgi:ribonuclease HI
MTEVTIYTDGGCEPNPGAGGYGVVLACGGQTRELSGGFARTTNNRMEIFAAIAGLESLAAPSRVTLVSDSRYLVDAIALGWAKRWRANGWRRSTRDRAVNADLWARLLPLCERHTVTFQWVKGHAGHEQNERCDVLAMAALKQPGLPADAGYRPEPEEAAPLQLNLPEQPGVLFSSPLAQNTPPAALTPRPTRPTQAEFNLYDQ